MVEQPPNCDPLRLSPRPEDFVFFPTEERRPRGDVSTTGGNDVPFSLYYTLYLERDSRDAAVRNCCPVGGQVLGARRSSSDFISIFFHPSDWRGREPWHKAYYLGGQVLGSARQSSDDFLSRLFPSLGSEGERGAWLLPRSHRSTLNVFLVPLSPIGSRLATTVTCAEDILHSHTILDVFFQTAGVSITLVGIPPLL